MTPNAIVNGWRLRGEVVRVLFPHLTIEREA